MHHPKPTEWTEGDWLPHLLQRACQLTPCADDAADLAHRCLHAFYDHFHHFPWQHPSPDDAWRWCCLKLHSLVIDAHRHAQRHPCCSLEELSEGVALVAMAEQVEEQVAVEAFLAGLPPSLRAALALRLAGYSWEEAAQQLGKSASTLRSYLPVLRAKFVAFFGYDPSKRRSGSLIDMEGENAPSDTSVEEAANGGNGDEGDGTVDERDDDAGGAGGGVTTALSACGCAGMCGQYARC